MTVNGMYFYRTPFFPRKNDYFYQKPSYKIRYENQEKRTSNRNIFSLLHATFLEWTLVWYLKKELENFLENKTGEGV